MPCHTTDIQKIVTEWIFKKRKNNNLDLKKLLFFNMEVRKTKNHKM